jgi:hypothetical protein
VEHRGSRVKSSGQIEILSKALTAKLRKAPRFLLTQASTSSTDIGLGRGISIALRLLG